MLRKVELLALAIVLVVAAFSFGYHAGYRSYLTDLGDWAQVDWPQLDQMCNQGQVGEVRIDCGDVARLNRIHHVHPELLP